jgi:hypothetical protein
MCARDHCPERQARVSVEEDTHARHLFVEIPAVSRVEPLKRLDRNVKPAAGTPLMPDPSDESIDEEHRVVARLPTRSQRALRGWSGKEQLAWLAADYICIEVRKEPNALPGAGREGSVSRHHTCWDALDLDRLELTREGVK